MTPSKLSNLLNNIAHAWHEPSPCPNDKTACLLDAEPGSYCDDDINSPKHKECKTMYPFECYQMGGEDGGAGSYCPKPTSDNPNERSCSALVADCPGSCCYGDHPNKQCYWKIGACGSGPETNKCECIELGGTYYLEQSCEDIIESGQCPQTVRPKRPGPIFVR